MMRCLVRKQLKRRRRLIWLLRLERFVILCSIDMIMNHWRIIQKTSRLKIRAAGDLKSE